MKFRNKDGIMYDVKDACIDTEILDALEFKETYKCLFNWNWSDAKISSKLKIRLSDDYTITQKEIKMDNVALVEQGASDEIKITLLGRTPIGIPQIHNFKGLGLIQINDSMKNIGINMVAWLVETSPWSKTGLPLIVCANEFRRIKITREEAFKKVNTVASGISDNEIYGIFDVLNALGLIKFEPEVAQQVYVTLQDIDNDIQRVKIENVIKALNELGYKIVKADK